MPAKRRLRLAATLAGIAWLAGCGLAVDSEQLRVCRFVLPALHGETARLQETGARADGATGVRIDYLVAESGEPSRRAFAVCRFAGAALSPQRLDLAGVDTPAGPLGDIRLHILRRHWLEAFGVAAAAAPAPAPALVTMPPKAAYALQQATNALALGSVYALLATAYALVYGLTGRLNLAFGELAVAGGFATIVAVMVVASLGVAGLALAAMAGLALAAATAALWSWAVSRAVLMPLHAAHRPGQPILVATVALAIAMQEGLRLAQGPQDRWLPPFLNAPFAIAGGDGFVATVTPIQIAVCALAVAACCGTMALMARSRFGRAWRACADDPAMAALLGIRLDRVAGATAALAGLMAGLGGFVVAVYYGGVTVAMGTHLGLKALVAAVLGGIGSLPGAFLGGFLVATVETLWSASLDIAWRDVAVFALIGILFALRPGGLFGFAGPRPRDV